MNFSKPLQGVARVISTTGSQVKNETFPVLVHGVVLDGNIGPLFVCVDGRGCIHTLLAKNVRVMMRPDDQNLLAEVDLSDAPPPEGLVPTLQGGFTSSLPTFDPKEITPQDQQDFFCDNRESTAGGGA